MLVNRTRWLICVAAGVVGVVLGAVASNGSGWTRIAIAVVIGMGTAVSVLKLTMTAGTFSESGIDHVFWLMVTAVAAYDGIASLVGAKPFADWSLGPWSLAFGALVGAGEWRDVRRRRAARRQAESG